MQSPILDTFMGFVTDRRHLIPPAAIFAAWVLYFYRRRGAMFVIIAIVFVALGDMLAHHLIKPYFARVRPCHVVEILKHVRNCTHSYSFPSNHAVNVFTFATMSALRWRKSAMWVFGLAAVIGFSRVYLGMHYPTDVLGGALCGTILGWTGYKLYVKLADTADVLFRFLPLWTPPEKKSSSSS